jgi:hypothetical protein
METAADSTLGGGQEGVKEEVKEGVKEGGKVESKVESTMDVGEDQVHSPTP